MERLTRVMLGGLAVIIAAGILAAILVGLVPGIVTTVETVKLDALHGYTIIARAARLTVKPGEPSLEIRSQWCSARYHVSPTEGLVEIEAGDQPLPFCKVTATLNLPAELDALNMTLQAAAATITNLVVTRLNAWTEAAAVTISNATLGNATLNLEASNAVIHAKLQPHARLHIHAEASSITIVVNGGVDIRVERAVASSITGVEDGCKGGTSEIILDLVASHATIVCKGG